jgi:hypothetical protein
VAVAVGGVVAVAVGVGVLVGKGVKLELGDGGMKPVGVRVGVRVMVGSTDGGRVDVAKVGLAVGEAVGVNVPPLGARRMTIRPRQ